MKHSLLLLFNYSLFSLFCVPSLVDVSLNERASDGNLIRFNEKTTLNLWKFPSQSFSLSSSLYLTN